MLPENSLTSGKRCEGCGRELASTELACMQCHKLVYGEELTALSTRAREREETEEYQPALENWRKAILLLPPDSTQAEWVRDHIRKLEVTASTAPTPGHKFQWAKKLGPLAPIAIALVKAKWIFALFKLKFLFSLFAFLGFYWAVWGWKFGVGFAILILIHEMGHYVDIRRRGLPAEMPLFLPGFGAFVRWQALGVSLETRAAVSLAGPLAGWIAAIGCLVLWWKTGDGIWAALARAGAWLNIMNLIPIWVLDGGQAAVALSKRDRFLLMALCLVLAGILGEGVFVLVAGGAAFRLFTKDLPVVPSWKTAWYFAGVLAGLAMVLKIVPGHGFGGQ